MRFAAPMLSPEDIEGDWTVMSPALFTLSLKLKHIAVLKMDCEGCEYALYDDIMSHNPAFFRKVDQFAVEFHLSRKWLKGRKEAVELGRLLVLLSKEGFVLKHIELGSCYRYML